MPGSEVSSAGHPPPLWRRSDDVEVLPIANVAALLFGELGEIPCSELTLLSGDRVLFYTHGVTDRRAPDDSMFDYERLAAAVGRHAALDPSTCWND